MVLLLDNSDIEAVLDMPACMDAIETAYRDLAEARAGYRPRIDFYVPPDEGEAFYRWGTMEGATRSLGVMAIRMKSDMLLWEEHEGFKTEEKFCIEPGTYCGLVFLLSVRNGRPLALMKDGYIQHLRVGACAGLGVKYLSRPDSRVLAMLGSGGMARTYAEAICHVRPITRINVFSPTPRNREAYAAEMSARLGVEVVPFDSPDAAVAGVDIIAAATDSLQQVLEPGWVRPGMHVTNVRSSEAGPDVIARANVLARLGSATLPFPTDQLPNTRLGSDGMFSFHAGSPEETGRIPQAPDRRVDRTEIPTLPDIIVGRAKGRQSPDDISFLNNQGTQGLQFAAAGGRAYELAKARGLGRELPLDWFTQDIRD